MYSETTGVNTNSSLFMEERATEIVNHIMATKTGIPIRLNPLGMPTVEFSC